MVQKNGCVKFVGRGSNCVCSSLKPFGDPAVLICTGFSGEFVKQWVGILTTAKLCLQVSLRVSFAHGLRKFNNQSQVLTHLTQVLSQIWAMFGWNWNVFKNVLKYTIVGQEVFSWEQRASKGQVSRIRIARFFAMFARFFKIAQGFCLGKTIWHVLLSFFQRCQVFSQGFHHLPHFCRDLLLFGIILYLCVSFHGSTIRDPTVLTSVCTLQTRLICFSLESEAAFGRLRMLTKRILQFRRSLSFGKQAVVTVPAPLQHLRILELCCSSRPKPEQPAATVNNNEHTETHCKSKKRLLLYLDHLGSLIYLVSPDTDFPTVSWRPGRWILLQNMQGEWVDKSLVLQCRIGIPAIPTLPGSIL